MERQARKGSLNDLIETAVIESGGQVAWVDGLMEITVEDNQQFLRRLAFILERKDLPPTKKRLILNGGKIKGVLHRSRAICNTPLGDEWHGVQDDGRISGDMEIPPEAEELHRYRSDKLSYKYNDSKGATVQVMAWFL